MSKVIIFIGMKTCPHCTHFENDVWIPLSKDSKVTSKYYLRQVFFDGENNKLPPNFSWVNSVPQLMTVSVSEYSRAYKMNQSGMDEPTGDKTVLKGNVFVGEKNLPNVNKWLMSN